MKALAGEIATLYRFRAATTKALAHPARFFMLETLAGGERCVCELREMVGLDLSTVSKHLALLRGAGLVTDERRGTQVFYRLPGPEVTRLLEALDRSLDDLARRRSEVLAASSAPRAANPERAS